MHSFLYYMGVVIMICTTFFIFISFFYNWKNKRKTQIIACCLFFIGIIIASLQG